MNLFDENLKLTLVDYKRDIEIINKGFQRFPKKYKWLEEAFHFYDISFVIKMHDRVTHLFESLLGKKLNWSQLWLFVEPGGGDGPKLKAYNCEALNLIIFNLNCSICNNINDWQIDIDIRWSINKKDYYDIFFKDVTDIDIAFQIKPQYEITERDIDEMPTLVSNEKPKSLRYDLSFPINSFLKSIPHEALISFIFDKSDPDVTLIEQLMNAARSAWNLESENARNIGDQKNDNGLIHNIYFSHNQDNEYSFYLDHGSANEGALRFLLRSLDGKKLGIKEVLIESI